MGSTRHTDGITRRIQAVLGPWRQGAKTLGNCKKILDGKEGEPVQNSDGGEYARFDKVSKGLGEVDQKCDKEFANMQHPLESAKEAQRCAEIAAQLVHDSREDYHRLSEDYEAVEDDLNEELGCVRALVGDTAAATSTLSCGTNDRDSNELKYFQEALRLVDSLFCWEA